MLVNGVARPHFVCVVFSYKKSGDALCGHWCWSLVLVVGVGHWRGVVWLWLLGLCEQGSVFFFFYFFIIIFFCLFVCFPFIFRRYPKFTKKKEIILHLDNNRGREEKKGKI